MRLLLLLLIAGCGRVGFDPALDGPASGLVVRLELEALTADPIEGTVTADATGHGHVAHCLGAQAQCPAIVPGRLGNAAELDGVDDVLTIDDAPALDLADGFTIAAWVEQDELADGCPYQKVLGTGIGDSWQLCIHADGSAYFYSSASPTTGGDELQVASGFRAGSWQHAAITWDEGLLRKEIWVDGMRIADSEGVALAPAFDAQPILLGLDLDNGAPKVPFRGRVDDFRIYDRALAPAELAELAAP